MKDAPECSYLAHAFDWKVGGWRDVQIEVRPTSQIGHVALCTLGEIQCACVQAAATSLIYVFVSSISALNQSSSGDPIGQPRSFHSWYASAAISLESEFIAEATSELMSVSFCRFRID